MSSTGYPTDAAGVPQPADTTELLAAIDDAPEHSFIESPVGTTYNISEPITMAPFVEWDGQGSTVVNNAGGSSHGIRLDNRSRLFNVNVDMGSSSGAAYVYDSALSRQTQDTTTQGGTVTATSGSGTRGVFVKADQDRVFGHYFGIETTDVDYPVDVWSPLDGGFVTSMYGDIKATNFETAVQARGDGSTTVNANTFRVNLDPGASASSALEVDHPDSSLNSLLGTVGDASLYTQLINVIETNQESDNDRAKAMHDILSRDGYSSDQDSSLTTLSTTVQQYDFRQEETPQVIDCQGQVNTVQYSSASLSGTTTVASPGQVQSAIDAAGSGDVIRLENGATYSADWDIEDCVVDARPAKLSIGTSTQPCIRYKTGGVLWQGHFDVSGYSGVVHEIRAESGETISGPCGPTGTDHIFDGNDATILNIVASGGEIRNVGNPYVHATKGGTCINLESTGTGSVIRNCEFASKARRSYRWVNITGNNTIENCRVMGYHQPVEGVSPHHVYCDNGQARDVIIDGEPWDPGRLDPIDGEARVGQIDAGQNISCVSWGSKSAGQCNSNGCWKDNANGGSDFFSPNIDLDDGQFVNSIMHPNTNTVERFYVRAGLLDSGFVSGGSQTQTISIENTGAQTVTYTLESTDEIL